MRRAIYNVLSATPTKIAGALSLGLTAWSAGNPANFQEWWGWAMTPDHIRIAGIIGFCIVVLYWLVLWWLKPKDENPPSQISVISHHQRGGVTAFHHSTIHKHVTETVPSPEAKTCFIRSRKEGQVWRRSYGIDLDTKFAVGRFTIAARSPALIDMEVSGGTEMWQRYIHDVGYQSVDAMNASGYYLAMLTMTEDIDVVFEFRYA